MVADVSSMLTGHVISVINGGHNVGYWQNKNKDGPTSEGFAEYYSSFFGGKTKDHAANKEVFPNVCKAFDNMINAILSEKLSQY